MSYRTAGKLYRNNTNNVVTCEELFWAPGDDDEEGEPSVYVKYTIRNCSLRIEKMVQDGEELAIYPLELLDLIGDQLTCKS
jgi:hypothetical protein